MPRQRCLSEVVAVVAMLLTGGPVAAQSVLSFTLPFGPHEVGFRSEVLFDASRPLWAIDSVGELVVPGQPRPLQVAIWYPALPQAGAARMPYREYVALFAQPPAVGDTSSTGRSSAEKAMLSYPYLFNLTVMNQGWRSRRMAELEEAASREYSVTTHAFKNAAPKPGSYPVIIYGPGAGGVSFENDVLMEYLASHGYIVVASPSWFYRHGIGAAALEEQARDFEFLAGYAMELPNSDRGGVALVGHSWGGLANVVVASRNSAVRAIVSLDGSIRYFFSKDYVANALDLSQPFTTPSLFLNQGVVPSEYVHDVYAADTTFGFFDSVRYADAYRVTLNIDHANLVAWYNRFTGATPSPPYFVTDANVRDRAYERAALFTLNFLNAYLKQDPSGKRFLESDPIALGMPASEVTADRKTALRPLPTAASFAAAAKRLGLERAPEVLQQVIAGDPAYRIPESELSRFGWSLQPKDAPGIFQVRVMLYPDSPAAHSDLGDAYLAAGDTVSAVRSFERVLSLDSTRTYARTMLQRIRKD